MLKTPAFENLFRRVEEGGPHPVQVGVSGSAQAFLAAALKVRFPDYVVVAVSEGVKAQEALHQDLQTWLRVRHAPGESLAFHAAWESMPHESRLPHADVVSDRLETLLALATAVSPLIVTNPAALLQRTIHPNDLRAWTRELRRGSEINPLDLIEWFEDAGYESEAKVTQKGEIALRGGIIDVFPLTSPWPVRLEFFGNELESLRYFDPVTQVSTETIETIVCPPAGEIGLLKRSLEGGGGKFKASDLFDHLPARTIWIWFQADAIESHALEYSTQIPAGSPYFLAWTDIQSKIARTASSWIQTFEPPGDEHALELPFQSMESFRPIPDRRLDPHLAEAERKLFFDQLHRWVRQGMELRVFCNNEGERDRFLEIWREYDLGVHLPRPEIGSLSRGFVYEPAKLAIITDAEIFGRYKVQRPRRLKSRHAAAARSALDIDFTDLQEGDYVVHLQHGIGRYLGLRALPGSGQSSEPASDEECLVIEYAPSGEEAPPKLYVPVSEAHLVSKYVGTGKFKPPLNTLGGGRWAKTRHAAERAVKDLASELLSIQAARESETGHPFPGDSSWQREFEGAFLYEETPDQMRAIDQTKKDMESARPMDRLICGDVGYGKTEVAIRGAFKAVMGGKQVAVLVPTTILAQQHFNNFSERMADYPVQIAQLSRFCTKAEQKKIIQQLAEGTVDIVIGTHRLLQSDIAFKDLGLVVIDEEQRFGVMHKEKFKLLRRQVDVLTLSATPIPRTLYLALTGARDMSTIETPPQDRLPVQTIVTQYDERVIRDAIQRELNRDGQVYFLHNRVTDIENVALRIRSLVPKARVLVGHGQMESDDLEKIMRSFINGEADVLVSTTIIESGIDIPNANTIVIDRADRFGLSDLYQLRGRVGRYKHQAYAYLLLPRHATLLTDVRKRISAIKQYSSLGSGFKIAMRDLEIRGAGNLLGPEQSGHITAVGFDLYCQLLKQSVSQLKGEKVKPRVDVKVALDFLILHPGDERGDSNRGGEAFIPIQYVREPHQRIEIYRKLALASDRADLEKISGEIRDRFGPIPPAVELLLKLSEIKNLAAEKQITSLETKERKLILKRFNDFIMPGDKFPRLAGKDPKGMLAEIRKLLSALPSSAAQQPPGHVRRLPA